MISAIIITSKSTKITMIRGITMSTITTKKFTIVYTLPNENGIFVSKTEIIADVISDLLYEGPFVLLKLKNDSVRRFHSERCITIDEVITERDAISAPAI